MALSYSSVRRRYSEFVWLHKQLKEEATETSLPPIPVKKVFRRFAVDFIIHRQKRLQEYIHRLTEDKELISNAHLHLFLQTNFTPNEIESILKRKDRDDVSQIIVLATTSQRNEYYNDNIFDSALNNSYSSLDLNDVIASSEGFSSGYYGDDEILDELDLSVSTSYPFIIQCQSDIDDYLTSSREFIVSFEDLLFEFHNKKSRRQTSRSVVLLTGKEVLVEYVMPISKSDDESYVVLSVSKREMPRRVTNDQRVKKLINEYEVVSLL